MKCHLSKRIFLALLAAACLLLSGCRGSTSEEHQDPLSGLIENADSQKEETVSITSFALPYLSGETLDPITCSDGMQQTLLPLLYEGLFELDTAFNPQNVLCASYTCSEDAKVWTFTLRSGVCFSDGSELRADDVVATLQRAKTSARYGARLSAVSSIRAEGGQVVITLSESNSRLNALLDIPIVSKSSIGTNVPLGTGPYVYQTQESGPVLAANSSWWQQKTLPVDTIPLRAAESNDDLSYLFGSHTVQMLVTDYTGSDSTSYKGNLSVTDAPTTTMVYLGFNCRGGAFSDGALRRAVSRGITRESLCTTYFLGHADAAEFPVSPASDWYPAQLSSEDSTEDFQQAMADAGYATGTHTTSVQMLVCDGNSFRLSAAKAIAAALSVCDLKVTLRTLPYDEYLSALQSGSFDLYYGEVRMTPDFNCAPLVKTGGSLNYGGFSDAIVDARLSTAFSATDAPKGSNEALLSAIQSAAPIAVICFKANSVVLQGGAVDTITPTYANPFYQFTNWKIHIKGETVNG